MLLLVLVRSSQLLLWCELVGYELVTAFALTVALLFGPRSSPLLLFNLGDWAAGIAIVFVLCVGWFAWCWWQILIVMLSGFSSLLCW